MGHALVVDMECDTWCPVERVKGGGAALLGPGAKGQRHGHQRRERDLGGMNAEVAQAWVEKNAPAEAVAAAVSGTPGQVEVEVRSVSLIEAVPRRGSKLVTYKTIAEIPLPGYVPPPSESESDLDFDDSEESDDDFVF